jgi:hypothetical protein
MISVLPLIRMKPIKKHYLSMAIEPFMGNQAITRTLTIHRTAQTQNKGTQTSMPQVGLKPTIPVFERAMTFMP